MSRPALRPAAARLAAALITTTVGFILIAGPASAFNTPTAQTATVATAIKASKNTVTISKIANKKVAKGRSVTIKPTVKVAGKIKVTSKTLTVVKSGKTVAKSKTSVALKAGTYTVTTTVKYKVGTSSAVKTKTLKQTLKITTQAAKKTRVPGTGGYDCPAGYPIKGNADSGIYHVPGGQYYSRTKPEDCFSTEAAAQAAGYRASKR